LECSLASAIRMQPCLVESGAAIRPTSPPEEAMGKRTMSDPKRTTRRSSSEAASREAASREAARFLFSAAVTLALLLLLAPIAAAGLGEYTCADPSKVYYGNHRLFQRPCHISCNKVYDQIPEYKEIVRKGLGEKDPQYHLLMKKATARFSAAVKKMARANNHDLVACVSAIKKNKKTAKDIPDRTTECIAALKD
jgi:hypothetical protein